MSRPNPAGLRLARASETPEEPETGEQKIARHAERLDLGFADRAREAHARILAAESDDRAPEGTAYVLVDRSGGVGAGLSWRAAMRSGLAFWVETMQDAHAAADCWNDLDELDPEAELVGRARALRQVVVQAEDPGALLLAVSALVEGHKDIVAEVRAALGLP